MLALEDTPSIRRIATIKSAEALLALTSDASLDSFNAAHPLIGNQSTPTEIRTALKTWVQALLTDLLPAERAALRAVLGEHGELVN